jgi:hypothetical protein
VSVGCDGVGDRRQGIAFDGFAGLGDALVGFGHEGVKVDAAFARFGDGLKEEVHQHGFAAPDLAVDVKAAQVRSLRLAPTRKQGFALVGMCCQII